MTGAPARLALVLLVAGITVSTPTAFAASSPRVGPEVPVTANDLRSRPANNSPLLAVDPTNDRFVAMATRVDNPEFGCAFHLSGDGGRGWLPARVMDALPKGVERCYGPEIAFDSTGRLFFVFVGLKGTGNRPVGVFIMSSTNRGRTWNKPRRILGPLRFQVRLAVDQRSGRVHLAWLEARAEPTLGGFAPVANPIMAAYSDDRGRRFSKPVQVSDGDRARVVAPALVLGPRGVVHVGYWDLGGDVRDYQGLEGPLWEEPWSLVVATSSDGGRRFGRGNVVDDDIMPPQRVMLIYTMPAASLATDDDGRLYAAWHDARNGDWDAFVRMSTDAGRSWGPPRRLNDDPIRNGRHQYLPRLSTSPGGRLDAIFYDRRNAEDNLGNDVYYTFSSDRSGNFAPSLRLTTLNFDSRVGARYANASANGLFDFGGRIALVSGRSGALAAWTDTRNTAARGAPGQDVYAAEITVADGEEEGSGGRVGLFAGTGAAAVAVGIIAFGVRRRRSRRAAPVFEGNQL